MAKKSEKETVAVEELVLSQLYTLNALINVLERKGILSKEEVLVELKELQNQVVGEDSSGN